jgi:hypothetical protein
VNLKHKRTLVEMRIPPQISGSSVVALGHFNPLIFRPEWLRDKEIVVGSDFEALKINIVHPEIVMLMLPWGQMQVDRDRFMIAATQEPSIRVCDFFVKCFQALPETPINAVGMNRDVHFPAGNEEARDHIGDVLAPKDFWGDFVKQKDGMKAGGLRTLVMEQAIIRDGRRARLDGLFGWIQVKVEPSLKSEVPNGVFVEVNDHYDMVLEGRSSDGKSAGELVAQRWDDFIETSDGLVDRIMELASGAA